MLAMLGGRSYDSSFEPSVVELFFTSPSCNVIPIGPSDTPTFSASFSTLENNPPPPAPSRFSSVPRVFIVFPRGRAFRDALAAGVRSTRALACACAMTLMSFARFDGPGRDVRRRTVGRPRYPQISRTH